MPAQLFEIFGYPVDDNSEEATTNRLAARCPFMNRDCDGGGNRYLSQINLRQPIHEELAELYPDRDVINPGICSIQPNSEAVPWIVCPRRLLVLGRERAGERVFQKHAQDTMLKISGYPSGTKLGVWAEVKIKYVEEVAEAEVSVDYTFDYVIMPLRRVSRYELETFMREPWSKLRPLFEDGGYTITAGEDDYYVEDCPSGAPNIIEIMTSSTSGGNKDKRSQIPMAFEDAMLGKSHLAPGINYRQVWARMASQLIAKSEIALVWGGKTIWVIQDVLAEYITKTTALKLNHFESDTTSEVNLLTFSYGNSYEDPDGVLDLSESKLYAGRISPPSEDDRGSFLDIIRSPVHPPLQFLIKLLSLRKPINQIIVP
jgi:hypothetical protein